MTYKNMVRSKFTVSVLLFGNLILLFVFSLTQDSSHLKASLAQEFQRDSSFVKRNGNKLFLDGKRFKFSGANIFWLGLDNTVDGTIKYPTKYRINDALDTAKIMGVNVVRTWAISVGCELCIEPKLNQFNPDGFTSLDYAVYAAKARNMRLVVTLTDNWHYFMGGKHTFTDWRGISDENKFYTDPAVISDYKNYISHILNHVNPYTGIAYKDDPTIMAWETGNELLSSGIWNSSWTITIANYLKSIAPNQLVSDGHIGSSDLSSNIDVTSLSYPNIDLYSSHFYPIDIEKLKNDSKFVTSKNKVYFVGEYDWNRVKKGDNLTDFLTSIESYKNISGDLFWVLTPHNDTYGFVLPYKPGVPTNNFHFPGDTATMKNRVLQIRNHAYAMREAGVYLYTLPGVPFLHVITRTGGGFGIYWRGVAGAATYTIDRSLDNSNWQTISTDLSDNNSPFIDTTADPEIQYYYRVKALNLDGSERSHSNIEITSNELLKNGKFEYPPDTDWLSFWNLKEFGNASARVIRNNTFAYEGAASPQIEIQRTGGTLWYVQLLQQNLSLKKNVSYTLNFFAKSTTPRDVNVTVQQVKSPSTVYFSENLHLSTDWKQYTLDFTLNTDESNAYLEYNLGQSSDTVFLDDISLKAIP